MAGDGNVRAIPRNVLARTEVATERGGRVEEAEEARAHDANAHLARGIPNSDREIIFGEARRAVERRGPFR